MVVCGLNVYKISVFTDENNSYILYNFIKQRKLIIQLQKTLNIKIQVISQISQQLEESQVYKVDMSKWQWLSSFDRHPAYINAHYRGRHAYQSKTGGCLSLVFTILTLIIFAIKLDVLLDRRQLNFQSFVYKDDFSALDLSDADFRISIENAHHEPIEFNQLSNKQPYEQPLTNKIPMQPCPLDSQPSSDPNNRKNNQQYNKSKIYELCIPKQQTNVVMGRKDVLNKQRDQTQLQYKYSGIKLIKCRTKKCMNESSAEDGQLQSEPINSFYPVLKFANHIVSQEKIAQKDAIRPHQIRLFQPELPLHEDKQTLHLTFDIKKVNITTDYSIVPNFIIAILPTSWTRNQTTWVSWFYGEQFISETYIPFKQQYGASTNQQYLSQNTKEYSNIYIAEFQRSMATNTYVRHFKKVDSVMGEVFGISSLISVVFYLLYKDYNAWILERENVGEQIRQNILHYYLFKWKQLVGCLRRYLCWWKKQPILNQQGSAKTNIELEQFSQSGQKSKEQLDQMEGLHKNSTAIVNQYGNDLQLEQDLDSRSSESAIINHRKSKQTKLYKQLDLYRSRRDINYLYKRISQLQSVIKKLTNSIPQEYLSSDIKEELRKEIVLSKAYDFTESMIHALEQKREQKPNNHLQKIPSQDQGQN